MHYLLLYPIHTTKWKNKKREERRVFFKPLNPLSCIYLYLHIIALRWRISSVQTALAQWITHPKMCRSTPYYIADRITSASVISLSNKLIYILYFFYRYLHFYQTFTIHFLHFTSFFPSFFIPSFPHLFYRPFYLKVRLFFSEPIYKYTDVPIYVFLFFAKPKKIKLGYVGYLLI